SESQPPILMQGNIVVPPRVDGRHLFVQTDLGQIEVLDIEPTATSKRVTSIARVPSSNSAPRMSWMAVEDNRLWIVDARLSRYDMQVAKGNLNWVWSKNEGDRFAGPPS